MSVGLEGGRIQKKLRNFNAMTVEIPLTALSKLAGRADVRYISYDRKVTSTGHLEDTTGTTQARAYANVLGTSLDGTGITIAILDSGIATTHHAFRNSMGLSRVLTSVNFTSDPTAEGTYGHGTPVASIAAGQNHISASSYTGMRPNA